MSEIIPTPSSSNKPPRSRRKAPTAAVGANVLYRHDKSKSKNTKRRSFSNPHKVSISTSALYDETIKSPTPLNPPISSTDTSKIALNYQRKPNFLMKSSYFYDTRSLTPTTRAYGRKTHSSPICEYFDNSHMLKQHRFENSETFLGFVGRNNAYTNLNKVEFDCIFEDSDSFSEEEGGGVIIQHEEEEEEDEDEDDIPHDYLQKGEFFIKQPPQQVNQQQQQQDTTSSQFDFMNNIKSIRKDSGSSLYSNGISASTNTANNNTTPSTANTTKQQSYSMNNQCINNSINESVDNDNSISNNGSIINYNMFQKGNNDFICNNNNTSSSTSSNTNNNHFYKQYQPTPPQQMYANNTNTINPLYYNYNNQHPSQQPSQMNHLQQQQQQQLYNYRIHQQQQQHINSFTHKQQQQQQQKPLQQTPPPNPQYHLPQQSLPFTHPNSLTNPLSRMNIKKITNQNYTTLSNDALARQAHIIARYQSGSRFLQQKLDDNPSLVETLFYPHILSFIQELSTDQYGYLYIKKLITYLSEDKLLQLIAILFPNFPFISTNQYGSLLLEGIIDLLKTDKLFHAFIKIVLPNLSLLLHDHNGSKVIHKLLLLEPATQIQKQLQHSILDRLIIDIPVLTSSKKGCHFLKSCIDSFKYDKLFPIIKSIEMNLTSIITNQYGNYVIQSVLEMKDVSIKQGVFELVKQNLAFLANQKYSSNVIEKCLDNNEYIANAFMKQILQGDTFERMLLGNFGNYVAQKVLSKADDNVKDVLFTKIVMCIPQLQQMPFGQKLLSKLLVQYPKLGLMMLN